MTDEDYVKEAGLNNDGTPVTETQPTPEVVEAKPVETFSIGENKFPVTTEFQFPHGGNIAKVPYSTLVNAYRQFQHMQDKWGKEYKPQIEEFQKTKQQYDQYKGFYDKYGKLIEWETANPDQAQRLLEIYNNRDKHLLEQPVQGANPDFQPILQAIQELRSQNEEYRKTIDEWKSEKQSKQEESDIGFIRSQIDEFKKEFSEIDVDEKDPDGVPLWAKIVQWANQNNYGDFTSAAHVYLKPRIFDAVATRARNEALKGVKQDNKQGIVQRSDKPILGQGQPLNIKNMSYAEIAELGKSGAFNAA